ncbi:GNAT superfamily N-acetyltransferase [Nocardioides thalensis]|uniref:GNAT superfamily N-acetyltransferase n=1 Tax=Nocardioides thalensis TaxID=1914755 RepID=A0A853C4I6_9ACTN|nr:GNAT family N-acetyltransferase [Nocardioides thalensis]NYJ01203.1 GNAT superfamily N-acetyltransferase [Nocardioides thalensis]
MDITRFGPDDAAALREWVALANAVAAVDAPWEHPWTVTTAEGRFRHGWDGEPATPYLARLDGTVVGIGSVSVTEYDNLHLAWFGVQVHPDHRRRGYGSQILAYLEQEAKEIGRTSGGIDGWDSEAAVGFAARHGYEKKHQAINRRQYLADIDRAELDRRYDAALPYAADYVLERWPVPTPDDQLDDLARMASAINDAPTDDLDIEDEVFTGDRMKAYEVATAGKGQRLYRVVARHVPTGELAGQTVVAVESERPQISHQHDTSVVRSHRGHRLGLLLKTDMLRWLAEAEPQVTEVDTWNAESNDQMIGVNEVLGYRVMGRELAFQKDL